MPLTPRRSSCNDADLIRAAHRHPASFEVFVERHARGLERWLTAQTGDAAVAHELLAEAFAQAWFGARRFRGRDDGSGAAWLYGIARNLLRQQLKRGRVEFAARQRLALSPSAFRIDDFEAIDARIDAAELAPTVREAFADQLQITAATARTRVFRGLQALRASIVKGVQP